MRRRSRAGPLAARLRHHVMVGLDDWLHRVVLRQIEQEFMRVEHRDPDRCEAFWS